MNEVAITTKYIIDLFGMNPMVHTISFNSLAEIDNNKNNIYPLVNVDLVTSPAPSEIIYLNYLITILQERNDEYVNNYDKLLNRDNLIDNLNECNSILTRTINNLEQRDNEHNIELTAKSNVEYLKDYGSNKLDGIRITLTLSIPNQTPCE